jgi:hypothetical protein
MKHNKWSNKKPDFTQECILITATKNRKDWDYRAWLIIKITGPGGWYWGLCEMDGEEWGDLNDMLQDKYLTMPLLK